MKMTFKTKFPIALATFCAFLGQAHAEHYEDAFAVVYADTHFEGWSYRILPGDSIDDFRRLHDGRWSFLDREIGSIEIHGEMKLELWSSQSFRGDSVVITESVKNLSYFRSRHSRNWNDRIASITAIGIQQRPVPEEPAPPPYPPRGEPDHPRIGHGEIVFFEDDNLQGEALVFDGTININRLDRRFHAETNWNDFISSIAISDGYEVTLYEHSNFQGNSMRIQDSIANLSHLLNERGQYENWNDRVSSIRITRTQRKDPNKPDEAKDPVATLFEDSTYVGATLALFDGLEISNLKDIQWNDRASSLQIDPGYVLTLYEHSNFRGQRIEISSNQENLNYAQSIINRVERWNDRASSLKITRKK